MGIGSSGKRTPRSIVYGSRMCPPRGRRCRCRPPGRRRSPGSCRRRARTSTACRAWPARPSWTLLMMASSAARSSVSASSRFVSSKRRAFSRATLMLEARVVRSRSSHSENASADRLERDDTDDLVAGDDRHDQARLGVRAHRRSTRRRLPRRRDRRGGTACVSMTRVQALAERARRAVGEPHAFSIVYGKLITLGRRRRSRWRSSTRRRARGSGRRRARTIASKSSCRASAWTTR